MSETDGRWLPLPEAARVLELEKDTLRKRLQRGEHPGRKSNKGAWLVLVPPGTVQGSAEACPGSLQDDAGAAPGPIQDDAAALREEIQALRAFVQDTLDHARTIQDEAWKAALAERDARLEAQAAHIADLRAALERERAARRWPGLRRWWRRLIEGPEE